MWSSFLNEKPVVNEQKISIFPLQPELWYLSHLFLCLLHLMGLSRSVRVEEAICDVRLRLEMLTCQGKGGISLPGMTKRMLCPCRKRAELNT